MDNKISIAIHPPFAPLFIDAIYTIPQRAPQ